MAQNFVINWLTFSLTFTHCFNHNRKQDDRPLSGLSLSASKAQGNSKEKASLEIAAKDALQIESGKDMNILGSKVKGRKMDILLILPERISKGNRPVTASTGRKRMIAGCTILRWREATLLIIRRKNHAGIHITKSI